MVNLNEGRSTTFGNFITAQFLDLSIDGTTTSDGELAVTGGWTLTAGTSSFNTYELISSETVAGRRLPNIPGSATTFVVKMDAQTPAQDQNLRITFSSITSGVFEYWLFDVMDFAGADNNAIITLGNASTNVAITGIQTPISSDNSHYIIADLGGTGTDIETQIARSYGWHHFRIVWNQELVKVYIDGILVGSQTNPTNFTADRFDMNVAGIGSGRRIYYRGDIRLYNLPVGEPGFTGLDVVSPKDTQLTTDWTNFRDLTLTNSVPVIDQSYENIISNDPSDVGGNGSTNIWGSQGFKVNRNGNVTQVAVKLDFLEGSPDDLQVAIFPADGVTPAEPKNGEGNLLGRWSFIFPENIPDAGEWIVIPLIESVAVTAGTQYHLVFNSRNSGTALNRYALNGDASGAYPDGQRGRSDDNGATWTQQAGDTLFRIYLEAEGERNEEISNIPLTKDSETLGDYERLQINDLSIDGTVTTDGELASAGGWTVKTGTGSNMTYELISGETVSGVTLPNIPGSDTTFVLKMDGISGNHELDSAAFPSGKNYYCVEWWFFDDMSQTAGVLNLFTLDIGVATGGGVLVSTVDSLKFYSFTTIGPVTASNIPRSWGWHHGKIIHLGGVLEVFIDNVMVGRNPTDTTKEFNSLRLNADGRITYFGDIKVYSGNCSPQVTNLGTTLTDLSDIRLTCNPASQDSTVASDYVLGSSGVDEIADGAFEYVDALTNHGWVIDSGTVATDTTEVRSGSRSAKISAGTASIRYEITPITGATVEGWFWDDLTTSSNWFLSAFILDAGATFGILVDNSLSTTNYIETNGAGSSVSNVARTYGWHHVRYYASPSGISVWLDDVPIIINDTSMASTDFKISKIVLTGGGTAPIWFVDDIVIYEGKIRPQESAGEVETTRQIVYEDCLQTGYITGKNATGFPRAAEFRAQGFKLAKTARVKKVALDLFKRGTAALPIRIEIWADDGAAPGEPENGGDPIGTSTGNPYITSIPTDLIPTGATGADARWIEVEFPNDVPELTAGTQYHLVMSEPHNTFNNEIGISRDSSGEYPDGQRSASSDSGATWTPSSGVDILFKIYTAEKPKALILANQGKVDGRQRTTALDQTATSGIDLGLRAGLVSLWHLDSAGTTATDSVGSNNGTTSGATEVSTGLFGSGNNALDFDGVNDTVSIPDSVDLSMRKQMTVSLWVNHDNTNSLDTLISKFTETPADRSWNIQTESADGTKISFGVTDTTGGGAVAGITPSGVLLAGEFVNVVCVFNGERTGNAGRMQIYINGENQTLTFAGTIPDSIADSAAPVLIGEFGALTRFWDGRIDEVAIWNRALSPYEVRRLFYKGLSEPTYKIYYNKSGAQVPFFDSSLECEWDANDVITRPFNKFLGERGYGEVKLDYIGISGAMALTDGFKTPDGVSIISPSNSLTADGTVTGTIFDGAQTDDTISPFLQKGPLMVEFKTIAGEETTGETFLRHILLPNKVDREINLPLNETLHFSAHYNSAVFSADWFVDERKVTVTASSVNYDISRGYVIGDGTGSMVDFSLRHTYDVRIQGTGRTQVQSTGGVYRYTIGRTTVTSQMPAFTNIRDSIDFIEKG